MSDKGSGADADVKMERTDDNDTKLDDLASAFAMRYDDFSCFSVPLMVEKGSILAQKFESNPTAYTKWVDATFPFMTAFLQRVSVILHNVNAKTVPELKLVRSSDYRFRLASSSSFETTTGVMTLFKCLAAHLEENGLGRHDVLGLLYNFDYFTRSERDCPSLGETVKEILGE